MRLGLHKKLRKHSADGRRVPSLSAEGLTQNQQYLVKKKTSCLLLFSS